MTTLRNGVVLDIAPTDEMYAHTNERFAERYFWWFFHIQEEPLPERMIESQTLLYLESHLDAKNATPGSVSADVFAEYLRCYDPASIRAVCEDYRASVTIDRALDRADQARGHRVRQPLTAFWGARGAVGELFDVLDLWRGWADRVGGQTFSGHATACVAALANLRILKTSTSATRVQTVQDRWAAILAWPPDPAPLRSRGPHGGMLAAVAFTHSWWNTSHA